MKLHLNTHTYPAYALCLSAGLLCGAWFFQYVLNFAPCQMCYWQRHAHKAVIIIAVTALIAPRIKTSSSLAKDHSRLWVGAISLALLISAQLGLWHMGVEFRWWEGPKTCRIDSSSLTHFNANDLLASLSEKTQPPACTDIVWSFLGFSMAGWNMLASLFGVALAILSLKRRDQHVHPAKT